MPSKYDALTQFLTLISKGEVRMKFSDIEAVIESELPDSAHEYAAWWSNDPLHVQAAAWMTAGWRKTDHSFHDEWVEFTKD